MAMYQITTNLGVLCSQSPYTQKQISYLTEIGESRLSEYINGRRKISHQHCITLCDFFHVNAAYLLSVVDDEKEVFQEYV